MKKALQISIAQTLFTIEEDAYAVLDQYLNSIRTHFRSTADNEDIITDIESRIAEQFQEMGVRIVTMKEVGAVMATMGKIEDFGSEPATPTTPENKNTENKKLYRDADNKILFGVCSGLSKYTGIDVLWIRIAFILLTVFTQGLGLIIYVIMIIAVPTAKTASQKLEMNGTPVTLDTISKNVKDKAEEISTAHGSKIMRILSIPFIVLKKTVDFLVRRVGPILRIVIGIIIAAGSIVGMIIVSFLAPVSLINGSSYVGFPITQAVTPALFYFGIVTAYLTVVIPLIFVFIFSLAILRKKSLITGTTGLALLFVWCVAVAGTGVAGASIAERLRNNPAYRAMYGQEVVEIPLTAGIQEISVSGGVNVTYIQGPEASITFKGPGEALDTLSFSTTTNGIVIEKARQEKTCLFCGSRVNVLVTVPSLTTAALNNNADLYTGSWNSSSTISVQATNGSGAHLYVQAPLVSVDARQHSHVYIVGKADKVNLNSTRDSRIYAEELER
jgi:phage shock protein PspC (stress-responsive transcriptional regulator)